MMVIICLRLSAGNGAMAEVLRPPSTIVLVNTTLSDVLIATTTSTFLFLFHVTLRSPILAVHRPSSS